MYWRVKWCLFCCCCFFVIRVSDSPIDLKLDLFNPAIKRLHIDIPARPIQLPPGPGPAAPGFDQHGSLSATFNSRSDDAPASSSTARDLSIDRNGPSTASSAITAPTISQCCLLYCSSFSVSFTLFNRFHFYMAIRPLWPQSCLLNLSWVELSWG